MEFWRYFNLNNLYLFCFEYILKLNIRRLILSIMYALSVLYMRPRGLRRYRDCVCFGCAFAENYELKY